MRFSNTRLRDGGARLLGLAALLAVQAACASADSTATVLEGPAVTPIAPEMAEATFDSAWSQIHRTYYDSTFGGLDWRTVKSELRPQAAAAATNAELRGVLQDMLGRLGDSHFAVLPGEHAEALTPEGTGDTSGDVGLEVRWRDEALVVTRVMPGGPAASAGVRPGWAIVSIQGKDVDDWAALVSDADIPGRLPPPEVQMVGIAAGALTGEEGTRTEIEFLDADDRLIRLDLERRRRAGEPIRMGNLPTIFGEVEHERRRLSEGCAGVVRFNAWLAPLAEPLLRALDELSSCRGLVLDLRGNMGGLLGMVPAVSGALLEERALIGTLLTRDRATEFYSSPRLATFDGTPTRPFQGPVAILVDELTVSAAEVFTAGLHGNSRARVFGTRTPGEALPSQTTRLPNGDVLLHAYADFTGPDGFRLEGAGIVPDEPLATTRADLLAGRDRPLEAALEWISTTEAGIHGDR